MRGPHPVFRALALPGVFALVAFTLVPVVAGGLYAFTDWRGLGDANWIGLDNFRQIFDDPMTRGALWHTLVLVGQQSGLTMVIHLAGLQTIPDDLVEASTVDGASSWMRFRRITLPLLRPAFIIASTLTLIFGLRVFDQILGLTGGGPVGATETLATQVWKQSFADGRFGYGAALSIVLTLIIGTLALLQLVVLRRHEREL